MVNVPALTGAVQSILTPTLFAMKLEIRISTCVGELLGVQVTVNAFVPGNRKVRWAFRARKSRQRRNGHVCGKWSDIRSRRSLQSCSRRDQKASRRA